MKMLPFQKGDFYKPLSEEVAAQMITSRYNRQGYLDAKVETDVREAAGTVHVRFDIQEGPLYRFGETEFRGLTSVPEKIARYELTYRPGDPYIRTKLFETQTQLYGTGLYEDLNITASTSDAKTADVKITLKERPLKWIKGGVGWGSEERERFTLALTNDNFLFRAYRLELTGTISHIWLDYKAEFVNRYLFGTRTEERAQASWRHEKRDGYDLERTRIQNNVGRRIAPFTRGSVNSRMDRTVVFNTNPQIAAVTPGRSDTRALGLGLNRDKTDDLFMPRRGTRANLILERGGGFLGGVIHFNKAMLDARGYHPVGGPVVGALAVRTGVVEEYPPSPEVPIFERFFIGGANTIRGYRERGVGQKDEHGSPLGGKYMLGATFELRFPVAWKFNGAVFVDGGQVGFRYAEVSMPRWKYGAGAGLRLVSPVGPLRLDFGYKLNRDPGDNDPWRIHLSLGESF